MDFFATQYQRTVGCEEIGDPIQRFKMQLRIKGLIIISLMICVGAMLGLLVTPNISFQEQLTFTILSSISFGCLVLLRLQRVKLVVIVVAIIITLNAYFMALNREENALTSTITTIILPNLYCFLYDGHLTAFAGCLSSLFVIFGLSGRVTLSFETACSSPDKLTSLLYKAHLGFIYSAVYNYIFMVLLSKRFQWTMDFCLNHVVESETLKKETELLRSRSLFFSCFSHELRNPLNCILGSIEYALKYASDSRMSDVLTSGKVCGALLINLINNILDMGKLDSKNLSLNEETRESKIFINNIWHMMNELIKKKNLQAEIYIHRTFPSILVLDEARMSQILLNLISNACKFTETGGKIKIIFSAKYSSKPMKDYIMGEEFNPYFNHLITPPQEKFIEKASARRFIGVNSHKSSSIPDEGGFPFMGCMTPTVKSMSTVSKIAQDISDEYALLYSSCRPENNRIKWFSKQAPVVSHQHCFIEAEIIDNGCGMTDEELSVVFQPFIQANKSVASQYGGTGLGLYITKSILDLMSGQIKVLSKKGFGTSFLIGIPVELPIACSVSKGPAHKSNTEGAKSKVIVIGSDELVSALLVILNPDLFHVEMVKDEYFLTSRRYLDSYTSVFVIVDSATLSTTDIEEIISKNAWEDTQQQLIILKSQLLEDTFDPRLVLFPRIDSISETARYIEEQHQIILCQIKSKIGVLIVDDDEFNRKVVCHFLRREGYQVFTAENGEIGFNTFCTHQNQIQVILMDHDMPICDGPTCASRIMAFIEEENLAPVSVFGLTGDISQETRNRFTCAGAKKVFNKPAHMDRLSDEIFRDIRFSQQKTSA